MWCLAVTPTFSISFVLMHFWLDVALFDGLSFKPKKTGLKGSIPAIVSITVGSSGIKDALGMILCNFSL